MTTHPPTTAHGELCPDYDQVDGVYWVDSTPDTDTWACRHCATQWTITVHIPGVA